MGLGSPRSNGGPSHPGEPGIGPDLGPPFTAPDEATRWLFSLNRLGIRPGLMRIRGLLADLGHPEEGLPTLVVAGTNGKGSTTRALACLLQAAGHRVATYTSPHLLNVHERILIDDQPVDAGDFSTRVERIRPLVAKHEASWFETLTALAVSIARDSGVDFFCCETGLGGRLDASNALPATATLLTTVGLDHQRILGETIEEIAAEKLGLLKRGVPLFCAVDRQLSAQVFRAAVTAGSPCHFLDELARWEPGDEAAEPGPTGNGWNLSLTDRRFEGLPDPGTPELRRNVALALLTLTRLESSLGRGLLPADPAGALGNLFLPGRYQTLLKHPDWIFDTAHNEQALRATLRAFTASPGPGRKILLFGAMYDKDLPVHLAELVAGCDLVVGVSVSLPRSRTSDELAGLFETWGLDRVPWPPEPNDGANAARTEAPRCCVAPGQEEALAWLDGELTGDDRVLVTGSCFTVAEVMYRLGFSDLEMTRHPLAYDAKPDRRTPLRRPGDETEDPRGN